MAAIQAKLVERQIVDVERNSRRKILFRKVLWKVETRGEVIPFSHSRTFWHP
jgi:hypothetical protein